MSKYCKKCKYAYKFSDNNIGYTDYCYWNGNKDMKKPKRGKGFNKNGDCINYKKLTNQPNQSSL